MCAIKNYVVEIVIVDTSSTDRTKEIELKYTDKVFDYPWVNDFVEARNFSIMQAENEYILVLDCDEIVTDISIEEIKHHIKKYPSGIGCLQRINRENKYAERVNKLFLKKFFDTQVSYMNSS